MSKPSKPVFVPINARVLVDNIFEISNTHYIANILVSIISNNQVTRLKEIEEFPKVAEYLANKENALFLFGAFKDVMGNDGCYDILKYFWERYPKFFLEKMPLKKEINKTLVSNKNIPTVIPFDSSIGEMLLAEAVKYQAKKSVEFLLSQGVTVNCADGFFGVSPISWAVINNDQEILKKLCQHKDALAAIQKETTEPLLSCFYYAKALGNTEILDILKQFSKYDVQNTFLKFSSSAQFAKFCQEGNKVCSKAISAIKGKKNKPFFSDMEHQYVDAFAESIFAARANNWLLAFENMRKAANGLLKEIENKLSSQTDSEVRANLGALLDDLIIAVNLITILPPEYNKELTQAFLQLVDKGFSKYPINITAATLVQCYQLFCSQIIDYEFYKDIDSYASRIKTLFSKAKSITTPEFSMLQANTYIVLGDGYKVFAPEKTEEYFNLAESANNEIVAIKKFMMAINERAFDKAKKISEDCKSKTLKYVWTICQIWLNHAENNKVGEQLLAIIENTLQNALKKGLDDISVSYLKTISQGVTEALKGASEVSSEVEKLEDAIPKCKKKSDVVRESEFTIYHNTTEIKQHIYTIAFIEKNMEKAYALLVQAKADFPEIMKGYQGYSGRSLEMLLADRYRDEKIAKEALDNLKFSYSSGYKSPILNACLVNALIIKIHDFPDLGEVKEDIAFLERITGTKCNVQLLRCIEENKKAPVETIPSEHEAPEDKSVGKEEKEILSDEQQLMLIEWSLTGELSKEDEVMLGSVSQSNWHAYWQNKKQSIFSEFEKATPFKCDKIEYSWVVGKTKYAFDGKQVQLVQGKANFYIALDQKLLDNIDGALAASFRQAFAKGMVDKAQGANGIKLIKGERAELKIASDNRLYSTKMYKNENGDYLIILDKLGNHTSVSNAVKHAMKIEEVHSDFNKDKTSKKKYSSSEDEYNGIDIIIGDPAENNNNKAEVEITGNTDE